MHFKKKHEKYIENRHLDTTPILSVTHAIEEKR